MRAIVTRVAIKKALGVVAVQNREMVVAIELTLRREGEW